jgi:tetratricopeptide (TPR) repeat protein
MTEPPRPPLDSPDGATLLAEGIAALKAGGKQRARDLLGQVIRRDPASEQAWLWLSGAVDTDSDRRRCLEQVLQINPHNQAARHGLALLDARVVPPAAAAVPPLFHDTAPPANATRPTTELPSSDHLLASGTMAPPMPAASAAAAPLTDPRAGLRPVPQKRHVPPLAFALIAALGLVVVLTIGLGMRFLSGFRSPVSQALTPTAAIAQPVTVGSTRVPTAVRPAPSPVPTIATTPTHTDAVLTVLPTSTVPAAAGLVAQGQLKAQQQDYRGAIADFTQALTLDPQSVDARYGRGRARANLGDLQSALDDFNQVLLVVADYPNAYLSRCRVYQALQDFQRALDDCTTAIQLKPDYADAYTFRGMARVYLGETRAAMTDYTQALQLDPNNIDAYLGRGFLRDGLGDHQGAIDDFTAALQRDPAADDAYLGRGRAYASLEQFQRAVADYTEAIRLRPDSSEAYCDRGVARTHLGDYKGAIEDCTRAIALAPDHWGPYYSRARARGFLGDDRGALADFDRALALHTSDPDVWRDRGIIREHAGDR